MLPPVIEVPGDLSWQGRAALGLLLQALCAPAWVRWVVSRAPPGGARVLLAAPCVLANVLIAASFDPGSEVVSRTVFAYLFGWLATFKVLAFSCGRGPLTQVHTLAQFAALLTLPIYPATRKAQQQQQQGQQQRSAGGGGSFGQSLARFLPKALLLAAVVRLLQLAVLHRTLELPRLVRDALYGLGMYAFISCLMDPAAALCSALLGLQLAPSFDSPWMAVSLHDWWAARWNITTSSVLRSTVYDVVIEGSWIPQQPAPQAQQAAIDYKKTDGEPRVRPGQGQVVAAAAQAGGQPPALPRRRPGKARRFLGLLATFGASGLAHEAILWFIQPHSGPIVVSFKWFAFFAVQAPLLATEAELRAWGAKRRLSLNPWLARACTLLLMDLLAAFLFFPPVDGDTDTAHRVVAALAETGAAASAALQAWLPAAARA